MVLAGDRGMISQKAIDEMGEDASVAWTRRRSRPQTAKCQSDRATVLFPANSTRTVVMQ